ncbi:glycosyltransferase family 4 protein [Candidatus Desantisbacteria bacterium]|nr:glycosyltransferase family 4 protein [Candidatus Desantisbacteria bacterium]
MQGLKILHIDTANNWRGGEQQALYLVAGLQEKGYPQIVVCQPDSLLFQRCQGYAEVIPVKMRGEWDVIAALKLAQIIDTKGVHLIHLHSSHAHALGLTAAKISKSKPKVVVSRRVDFHLRRNPITWIKYRLGVDRIIAVSNAIKQVLLADGIRQDRIAIVHDGIDVEKFSGNIDSKYLYQELGLNPCHPIVGIIAALAPHKDHKTFLRACSHVKHQVQFLIVGDGKLKGKLQQIVKRLNMERDVIFTGFRDDIPQILSILNVFVVSSCLEGLNTSILEAQAAGVPVIATRTGGIPEIIHDEINGLLVPPQDTMSLAEGIIRLLEDKTLAMRLSAKGREDVKKFSKEAMVDATESIYHQLMDSHKFLSDCIV